MMLVIGANGTVTGLYDEMIDLGQLGALRITRASHVEPDELGQWWADLSPVDWPKLGPFEARSYALAAEIAELERWLFQSKGGDSMRDPT